MNLPTCKATVVGESITDATIILASVDPCYSCTERVGVYEAALRYDDCLRAADKAALFKTAMKQIASQLA